MKRSIYIKAVLALSLFATATARAQDDVYPTKSYKGKLFITGGTIHIGNGQVIEGGSIEIDNGKIVRVGAGLTPAGDAKVVDAKGKLITASATENPDYFWAARGAGPGFFGIAVRYHLKLQPLPRAITSSVYYYPYEQLLPIATWLDQLARRLPSSVELSLFAVKAPAELAEKARGSNGKVALVSAVMFADSADTARSTRISHWTPVIVALRWSLRVPS